MPIRVLLTDDDPLVRSGLALMLGGSSELQIVGEAGDGRARLELQRVQFRLQVAVLTESCGHRLRGERVERRR